MTESQLDDGRIPANTECPFAKVCDLAIAKQCKHTGVEHDVPYSCAIARGFDVLKQYRDNPELEFGQHK